MTTQKKVTLELTEEDKKQMQSLDWKVERFIADHINMLLGENVSDYNIEVLKVKIENFVYEANSPESLLEACNFKSDSPEPFPIEDEHLAKAHDILRGENYNTLWNESQKAGAMISIIRGTRDPGESFDKFIRCIEYLKKHINPKK